MTSDTGLLRVKPLSATGLRYGCDCSYQDSGKHDGETAGRLIVGNGGKRRQRIGSGGNLQEEFGFLRVVHYAPAFPLPFTGRG